MINLSELSRRDFLKLAGAVAGGEVLSACNRSASERTAPPSTHFSTPTRIDGGATPLPTATEGATATPTPEPTATPTPEPTATPSIKEQRYEERAEKIAQAVGVEKETVLQQLKNISDALTEAIGSFGSVLWEEDIREAVNPTETSGISRYPAKKRAEFILPEGGTGFISFGGGKVVPDKGQQFSLPNGVVDLSKESNLAQDPDYPYTSQAYLVVLNLGAGPDVLPPQIPDQDLNGKVVVRTNADLKNSYIAYGPYNAGGHQQERTIGIDWLAEQVWWATGGATSCGTGCGLARLVLVHEMPNPANQREVKTYISLVDTTRIIGVGGVEYRSQTVFGAEYTKAGIKKMEKFLSKNVLPDWPDKPEPTVNPTP